MIRGRERWAQRETTEVDEQGYEEGERGRDRDRNMRREGQKGRGGVLRQK